MTAGAIAAEPPKEMKLYVFSSGALNLDKSLIQNGARLVTKVEDILDEVAPHLRARLVATRAGAATATLTPPERRVLDALEADGRHVDDVIRVAAAPPGTVLETLLALELRGLVRQLPGKRFCRLAA